LIPLVLTNYHKEPHECPIHGWVFVDPVNKAKGTVEQCPECNPSVQTRSITPPLKVYKELEKTYPEEIQLKASDIPIIRKQLVELQDGVCPLCGKHLVSPVVDHWHSRGNKGNSKVRSAICAGCNSLLGVIENHLPRYLVPYSDASSWLRNVANYLVSGTTNLIHPTERPRVKLTKTEFKVFAEFVKSTLKKTIKYPAKGLLTIKQEEYYKQFKELNA
jgi:hypothetical protein